jgi:hypothetical protein
MNYTIVHGEYLIYTTKKKDFNNKIIKKTTMSIELRHPIIWWPTKQFLAIITLTLNFYTNNYYTNHEKKIKSA